MPDPRLLGEFFQFGYVTKDIDAALELYKRRYGLRKALKLSTRDLGGTGSAGTEMQVALAYLGPNMIEFIQPRTDDPAHYREALREDGGVSLHHLGYLVTEERFQTLARDLSSAGFDVPVNRRWPIGASVIYGDTRLDTGLYSEFVYLEPGGVEFFSQIPRNDA
jgi:extradiol dioxygenase family protein